MKKLLLQMNTNSLKTEKCISMKTTIQPIQTEKQHLKVTFQHWDIEIEMTAIPFDTGRCTEYQLEPDWFNGQEAEEYWNENWEEIWDSFEKELNK